MSDTEVQEVLAEEVPVEEETMEVAEEEAAAEEAGVEEVAEEEAPEEEEEAELEVDLDALPKMKVSELKDILKALDLPISGIKTALIERIQEHFANEEAEEPAVEEADAAEEELLKEDEPETNVSLRASDSFIHNESTTEEAVTEDAPVAVSEEPKAELTEEEKLKKRAEKFGATDAVVPEEDKKEARAAKFGILTEKSVEDKKAARAAKFAAEKKEATDDKAAVDEKKAARAARFNNGNTEKLQVSTEDKTKDDEKLKKRAARFVSDAPEETPAAKVVKYDIEEVLKEKKEKTGTTNVELKGESGEPLTISQLQKQLWEEAAQPGTLREELIKKIAE